MQMLTLTKEAGLHNRVVSTKARLDYQALKMGYHNPSESDLNLFYGAQSDYHDAKEKLEEFLLEIEEVGYLLESGKW